MARSTQSILEMFDLESPYVTEYRRLLYRVTNHPSRSEVKSVMITSAMVAEGKSTICSFLGLTASMKKGLKTLIVDADLRLPSIARLFALRSSPGLAEVLVDGHEPRDAIQKLSIPNLEILTAGRVRENPTQVFDPDAISQLLDELKFYYDLILVDCTPLLPVSDPMLLAPSVDGVLLVVKAGGTQREIVSRAVDILDPERANVLGVVLNNMNNSLPYFYNYEYYHYDYRQSPEQREQMTEGTTGKSDSGKKPQREDRAKDDVSQKN